MAGEQTMTCECGLVYRRGMVDRGATLECITPQWTAVAQYGRVQQ
jgi:hypothetical protein